MQIKGKFLGIFGKVFLYTMLILIIVFCGMFAFFSSQIKFAVTATQQLQLSENFRPLLDQLRGRTDDEIKQFAQKFHEANRSFDFRFQSTDGKILYQTEGFEMPPDFPMDPPLSGKSITRHINMDGAPLVLGASHRALDRTIFLTSEESGLKLYVSAQIENASVYGEILEKAVWAFGLVFMASLLAALIFAFKIAKPIRAIASDTHRMSLLEPMDAPKPREDEIGQLARDVYSMYNKLKSTIHQLEEEIERKKQMEENQRYFFSAASHELKTPVAATSAILEGMINEVITPEEYPAYLRECMKLTQEQTRLISEILDIVKLSGESVRLSMEPTALKACVDAALEPLLPLIEAKEQQLTVEVGENLKCKLDGGLFSKVLSNVVLNGSQNSPEGAQIRIWAKESADCVRLSVWNTGTQIPKTLLPKLFEPFYRANGARTSGSGRSGLGLTIVKKALDYMGIGFKMENLEDGVLFCMDLPLSR